MLLSTCKTWVWRGVVVLSLLTGAPTVWAQDTAPPSAPGATSSVDCLGFVGGTCQVRDTGFRLTVTAASDTGGSGTNPNGYQFCRSQDLAGASAVCEVTMTSASSTTFSVTHENRPPLGKRRAYWARASDHAGNWGPWSPPFYVETIHFDSELPSATGPVTSPSCASMDNGTCVVDAASTLTLSVTPATDSDSGVNPSGYAFCRSSDALGESGCEVSMTQSSTTTFIVPTSHRPPYGTHTSYYARASDQAGNWGPWSAPLRVRITGDNTPPVITTASAKLGSLVLEGALTNATTPRIDVKFSATDSGGLASYELLLRRVSPLATVVRQSIPASATAYTLVPPNLADGHAYTLSLRALDAAGNSSSYVQLGTFQVDQTPPTAVSSLSARMNRRDVAGQEIPWSNPRLDVRWAAASDANGVAKYEARVVRSDGQVVLASTTSSLSIILEPADLPAGTSYTVQVLAVDTAGNSGAGVSSGSFAMGRPLSASVNFPFELLITALPVVDDPVRTAGCGAWTLCSAMSALAGEQDVNAFTTRYFKLLGAESPRLEQSVNDHWPRDSWGNLDAARSPLRLLAIVNRFDLVKPGTAGEARLIFGFRKLSREYTLIFEYDMSTAIMPRAQWWAEWHRLNQFGGPSTAEFRQQLQYLTDLFTKMPVAGQIALGQVRTNDMTDTIYGWSMREFIQAGPGGDLVATTVKQSPSQQYYVGFNTAERQEQLAQWVNAHEAAIMDGSYEVKDPIVLGTVESSMSLRLTKVTNVALEVEFMRNTCSGCHLERTQSINGFGDDAVFMVTPRDAGQTSRLHRFFTSEELCGRTDCNGTCKCVHVYKGNEAQRRVLKFQEFLSDAGFKSATKSSSGAASKVNIKNLTDRDVVTGESLYRVH